MNATVIALIMGRFGVEVGDRLVRCSEETTGRTYHPWAEVVLLVDGLSWSSFPAPQECEDLERTLGRRLAELGG